MMIIILMLMPILRIFNKGTSHKLALILKVISIIMIKMEKSIFSKHKQTMEKVVNANHKFSSH